MPVGIFQNGALRLGQPLKHRPRWPYAINTDNWQSEDLILCPAFNVAAGNNQTLFDLTEGRRHGTPSGSPIWTHDPQMGECLYFGGSQARRVTWGNVFPTLTAATIFLVLRNFGNNNGSPIGFTSDDFFCTHYPFSGSDDGNSVFLSTLNSSRINFDDSSFSKKQWHVLAITSVNGSVTNGWKVFQNGRRVGQATSPSSITFHSTRRSLGQASDGSSGCQAWSGFIADFRLYNRAMSEAEVAAITLNTFCDLYTEIGRQSVYLPLVSYPLQTRTGGKSTASQTPLRLLSRGDVQGKAGTRQTVVERRLSQARTSGRSRTQLTQTQLRLSLSNHYAARVLATPNLELYYRMNEASGTTVKDYAPRGLDGTSSGLTLNQTGVTFGGKAISPNDNDSYIRRASSDVFANVTTQWSFEFWLKLDESNVEDTYLNLFGQPLDDNGDGLGIVWLYLNWEASNTPPIYDGFDVYTRTVSIDKLYHYAVIPKLPRGQWLHVAFRVDYETQEQAVFINGVEQSLHLDFFDLTSGAKLNSPNNTNDFYIFRGRQLDNSTPNSYGNPVCQISEFAIYSRALTDSEITSHYNAAIKPVTIQGGTRVLFNILDALGFGLLRGRSTATGNLKTNFALNGVSTARNRTKGDLLLSLALAGSTIGRGRIPSTALSLLYALSGTVRANSSAKASVLSVAVPIVGSINGRSKVVPALDEWRVYAGPRHVRTFTVKIRDSRTFKV